MSANGWLGGENGDEGSRQRETRWLTPRHIVEPLGQFDLDPCGAPGHELAARTYLLENGEDGLALDWAGRVWLNPPYGGQMEPFLAKMADHQNGTALIFARTETRAFHRYVWDAAVAVLFPLGRLNFHRADGSRAKANAGAPSCLIAYSPADFYALCASGIPGKIVTL